VSPGVLCALGDATTRNADRDGTIAFQAHISNQRRGDHRDFGTTWNAQVRAELKADGVPDAEVETAFEIDVRYERSGV